MPKRVWATLVGNFPTSNLYFPSLSQVNGYLHWVTLFYSFFELLHSEGRAISYQPLIV
ncbi:MAG: hypothetical protein F6J98_19840 [Moorea sp. SIO4G2]|nr:hypothetical protein [Moorena sp. SIO4G2]